MSSRVVPSAAVLMSGQNYSKPGVLDSVTDIRAPDMDDDNYDVRGEDKMALSVRGVQIVVDMNSLSTQPEARLSKMAKLWRERSEEKQDENRSPLYVNRNPAIVQCILDYHVTGELHLPEGVCGRQLRLELAFWGLGEELVSSCCLCKLKEGRDTADCLRTLHAELEESERLTQSARTWQERLWAGRCAPFHSRIGLVWYGTGLVLYSAFLLVLVLMSLSQFRFPLYPGRNVSYTSVTEFLNHNPADQWLDILDFVLMVILTCLFLALIWACPDRRKFLTRPANLLWALSMAAQWLPVTMYAFLEEPLPDWYQRHSRVISSLRLSRIVPIIAALEPYKSMRVLKRAMVASGRELLLLVALMAITTVLFGYMVFLFEVNPKVESNQMQSLPDAFWWALVTMTTVGYGDFYPMSHVGKLIGAFCACTGIIVIALPVPMIARNFSRISDLVDVAEYRRSLVVKASKLKLSTAPGAVKPAF